MVEGIQSLLSQRWQNSTIKAEFHNFAYLNLNLNLKFNNSGIMTTSKQPCVEKVKKSSNFAGVALPLQYCLT